MYMGVKYVLYLPALNVEVQQVYVAMVNNICVYIEKINYIVDLFRMFW